MISGPLRDIDRGILKGMFLNGLKDELRVELKIFELETLVELNDRAILLEQRNVAWKWGETPPGEGG